MKRLAVVVFAVCVGGWAEAADKPAEKIDWKICEKEMKDYGCKGSDAEIWACLEEQDAYLGDVCQKEHRKGDKQFGVVISPGDVKTKP